VKLAANDRDGIVMDVATVLAENKVKVRNINARGLPDGTAIVNMVLSVRNAEQLADVLRRLNRISGVRSVHRSAG